MLYGSARTRAKWVYVAFALYVVAALLNISATFQEIELLQRIDVDWRDVSPAEADASDARVLTTGLLSFTALVAAVTTFCFWIHRANRNLPVLTHHFIRFSPGWSIGWFFYPDHEPLPAIPGYGRDLQAKPPTAGRFAGHWSLVGAVVGGRVCRTGSAKGPVRRLRRRHPDRKGLACYHLRHRAHHCRNRRDRAHSSHYVMAGRARTSGANGGLPGASTGSLRPRTATRPPEAARTTPPTVLTRQAPPRPPLCPGAESLNDCGSCTAFGTKASSPMSNSRRAARGSSASYREAWSSSSSSALLLRAAATAAAYAAANSPSCPPTLCAASSMLARPITRSSSPGSSGSPYASLMATKSNRTARKSAFAATKSALTAASSSVPSNSRASPRKPLPKRAKRNRRTEQLADSFTGFLEVWVSGALAQSLADRASRLANLRCKVGTRMPVVRSLLSRTLFAGRSRPGRTNQTAQELLHHCTDFKNARVLPGQYASPSARW